MNQIKLLDVELYSLKWYSPFRNSLRTEIFSKTFGKLVSINRCLIHKPTFKKSEVSSSRNLNQNQEVVMFCFFGD